MTRPKERDLGVRKIDPKISSKIGLLEGYSRWAETYDREVNPLIDLEESYVLDYLDDFKDASVLDVGAGTGRYALRLARRGCQVTAIDNCEEMLAFAREADSRDGLGIHFAEASLQEGLPVESSQFDLVVCALVICHLPDLSGLANEFYRVMKPGGHLLVTDFHPDSLEQGWRTMFMDLYNVTFQIPNVLRTKEAYLDAMTKAGLELADVQDLPLRDTPGEFFSTAYVEDYGDVNFSLILSARKPASS